MYELFTVFAETILSYFVSSWCCFWFPLCDIKRHKPAKGISILTFTVTFIVIDYGKHIWSLLHLCRQYYPGLTNTPAMVVNLHYKWFVSINTLGHTQFAIYSICTFWGQNKWTHLLSTAASFNNSFLSLYFMTSVLIELNLSKSIHIPAFWTQADVDM